MGRLDGGQAAAGRKQARVPAQPLHAAEKPIPKDRLGGVPFLQHWTLRAVGRAWQGRASQAHCSQSMSPLVCTSVTGLQASGLPPRYKQCFSDGLQDLVGRRSLHIHETEGEESAILSASNCCCEASEGPVCSCRAVGRATHWALCCSSHPVLSHPCRVARPGWAAGWILEGRHHPQTPSEQTWNLSLLPASRDVGLLLASKPSHWHLLWGAITRLKVSAQSSPRFQSQTEVATIKIRVLCTSVEPFISGTVNAAQTFEQPTQMRCLACVVSARGCLLFQNHIKQIWQL